MTHKLSTGNCVVTKSLLNSPPEKVWKELVFYENIKKKKPLLLRLFLPVPIRNVGNISKVGDVSMCLYDGGYIRKRITQIVKNEIYRFEIREQALSLKLGIKLLGGHYSLKKVEGDKTEVTAVTNYHSDISPRWIWKPFEFIVCHWFHKYLLNSINFNVQQDKLKND